MVLAHLVSEIGVCITYLHLFIITLVFHLIRLYNSIDIKYDNITLFG